ncbi:MAG: HAMP domain-containing histidine kinase [Mediterranea sp.]|nr:HAMP domain-containing histidine kinase [Mediterranea sp.]
MERRIKIIWMLSLVAMFVLTLGQGYWLWNLCRDKNRELGIELHHRLEQLFLLNDSVRSRQHRPYFGEGTHYSIAFSSHSIFRKDSVSLQTSQQFVDTYRFSSRDSLGQVVYDDSIVITTPVQQGWMGTTMDDYKLEADVPFTLQRFDSLLAVSLPALRFATRLYTLPCTEWYQNQVDSVSVEGSCLRPVIRVRHFYSLFHGRLVEVRLFPSLSTLVQRLWEQLAGSLLMIFFLGICFWLQMRVIRKQRRIEELRSSFTGTMIHELKRPVQTLKMCVALMGDRALRTDEQTMDEAVHDSVVELDNLSSYLRKLRDMTRADDEQLQLTLSTFRLRPVVEKMLAQQSIPPEKQVTFRVEVPDALTVTADVMHLSNILGNLLENAIKYSDHEVEVDIRAEMRTDGLHLRVNDNGIGIPVNEQERVFDKFYRCHRPSGEDVPGIGLGLSYVKLLVEAHRGTVYLSGRPSEGTQVEITIPQNKQ